MNKLLTVLLTFITATALSQSVTVLPQDGTYGQNAAPQGAFRYQRQFYLITQAEMIKAGFVSGMTINSIGFTIGEAQSDTAKGKFQVYLQNTSNTVSRTDSAWTTASTTNNYYNLNGLIPGNYEWQIQSVCAGTSVDTTSAVFTNSNLTNCNQPTNFTVDNITTSTATLHWVAPASANVIDYVVQYKTSDSVNWIIDTVNANFKNLTGLLPGKNYIWNIKTLCSGGSSNQGSASFNTEPAVAGCNVSTGLNTTAITGTSATISWNAAAGASYYSVQYRRSGTSSWFSNLSFATSANLTGLKTGTTYEWKVRTVCGAGNGSYVSGSSFTTTGTTLCYAPAGLSADSLTDSSAVLSWVSTGATSYTIRYRLKNYINWSNVTPSMTSVKNDSITIPKSVGAFNIPLTTTFNYNGNGLYVAFEFSDSSGTLPTANTALCTSQSAYILSLGAHNQNSVPAILTSTNLRPETRFGSPGIIDSVEVSNVYALGSNAIPYGNPTPVTALIKNHSGASKTYAVTLTIKDQASNAVRYTANKNVIVAANSSQLVPFTGWSPTLQERDSIIVSVPTQSGENYILNNSNYYLQNVNSNILSYDDGTSQITSAGFDTLSGLILSRHTMNGCGRINGAQVFLSHSAQNHQLHAVLVNAAGTIVDSSSNFTPDSSQVNNYHSFYFLNNPVISGADYYVGLAQTRDSVNGYKPVGVQWEGTAVRSNAYYRAGLAGGTLTDQPLPGRLMIRAEIVPAVPSLTISGQTALCPSGTNMLTASSTSVRFADSLVGFSSQSSGSAFAATQALGTPDVYPSNVLNTNDWISATADGQREYIALKFSHSAPVNYVDIYETYNPGAVDTVYVKNPGTGNYDVVYADSAVATPAAARIKRVTFPLTSYNVSEVRIAINSPKITGYNAIDAVSIGAVNDPAYISSASYLWTGGATTQSINVSAPGAYSVSVTDANNCPQSATVNIINRVIVTPTISASRPLTFCADDSTVLTSSQPNGNLWSTGATTQSITVKTAGNYTVSYNDGFGCGVTTSTATTISVNPLPVVSVTGSLAICFAGSTSLNSGAGYTNYFWSTSATTQSISVSTAGNFSVTVTDANGCKGKRTVTTSIASSPNPVITGSLSFCPGSSTTLNAGAYTSYNWSTGATTQTITANTASAFTVTVTNSNGCTGSRTVNIGLLSPPSPFIVGNLTFCPGNSTSLTANFGYSQYLWSTSATTIGVSVNSASTFTVTVTGANGCTGSATAVTQLFAPTTPVIAGNTSLCPGTSTILDAGTGFHSFLWSTGDITHSISVNAAGTYTVAVTDSNNCAATGTVTTTISNTIIDSVNAITYPFTGLCNSLTRVYTIAPVANATFYQWTIPAQDSIISGQGTTSVNIYFRSFSPGIIAVVAINSCGQSPVKNLDINIPPATPLNITGPDVVCRQNGKTYTTPTVPGVTSFTWTVPTGATIANGQGTNSITVNFSGTFSTSGSVCVKANNACGSSLTRCFTVTAKSPMPGSITGPVAVCKRQANVNYSIAAVSGATSYAWDVPPGSKVISGQGTTSVNVTFGNLAGNVSVNAVNACGNGANKFLAVAFNCREEGVNLIQDFNAYPNPASGLINLSFNAFDKEKYLITVFDIIGNLVMSGTCFAVEGINNHELDMSRAAKGMYLIRIEREGAIKATKRIVVE